MGKHQAITVPIRGNGKALEVGAWILISERFLYLSGAIHLIGRCLMMTYYGTVQISLDML
mgnify:FL=1